MASNMYPYGKELFAKAALDWSNAGASIRVMLVSSSYAFSSSHRYVSDINAGSNEISVSGYARQNVTSRTVMVDSGLNRVTASAGTVDFGYLASGQAIDQAIVYLRVGADDSTPGDDILICALDPSNVSTNGGQILLTFPSGLFNF